MLTCELRTMDLDEVVKLWEEDKGKLKVKLLDDYEDLVKEYRTQIKIYNQETDKQAFITNRYVSCEKINYQLELDIKERIRGRIIFTKDLVENIKIAIKVIKAYKCGHKGWEAHELSECIRLKAMEISQLLKMLNVKVSYTKDFERQQDKWQKEDLDELFGYDYETLD